ncbi:alkaline phosphatase family protein [Roseateles sp.]|uniref:alkaline phosphatase family protein n=1 Tax=Roseateles sp. TaxID=1971397 RepID=UPI0031CE0E65
MSSTPRSPARRRLLQQAAGATGLALLPPSVQLALAKAQALERPASLKDIKHVVLLMQENRSFDHYFGTMAGVRGFDDPEAMTLQGPHAGKSVFQQPDPQNPDGFLLPFHLDTRKTSAQRIPSTNHSWKVQHEAWNGGRMDNWVPAHRKAEGENGPYTMGHYRREDIPFHFALAEAFTICDGYHSSLMGPTWPNRMYWMTGTIDADGSHGGPVISNKKIPGGYTWTTYAERLEAAGVSWKVYQQQDNYGTNMLELFKSFMEAPKDSPLRVKGLTRGPEGQFEDDARNDRLPTVSWILPTSFQSEHPQFTPAEGAAFIASKIEAIAANPEVWAKTVFILNYDENDGLFDHVAPPVPPAGTPGEFVKGVPAGGGFRVPAIIVSPWTAGGWVSSQPFDHTSVLQFLERITGVKEPNISEWRRRTFGDMTSVFGFEEPKATSFPVMPDARAALVEAKAAIDALPKPVLPSGNQAAPRQEKGVRKRRG